MNIDINNFWERFAALPTPSADETVTLGQMESAADFEENGRPSPHYIQVQKLYRMLVSMILVAKSGLDQLDKRLQIEGFLPRDEVDMDYYQRYDLLGLHFFYLRSYVHVERLSQEEMPAFADCLANRHNEEHLLKALQITDKTFRKVLKISPKHPQQRFELFPSIYGEGIVSGDTIVLGLCSKANYDAQGMLVDTQLDDRRIWVCRNVQRQLEPILQEAFETNISVIVEV